LSTYRERKQPYLQGINQEYKLLLDHLTQNPGREKEMQEYLEKRTLLLPGIHGVYEETNHGIFSSIIFSQLRLAGLFTRVPDFVFVTKTSVQLQVVFIEIEDPAKKFFNKDNSFTSEFNKAFQQLEDWNIWFQDASNQQVLRNTLNLAINHHGMKTLPMKAEYVLVYGRNSEYENQQIRINRLSAKNNSPYKVMSYDRLSPYYLSDTFITVKKDDNGFYAIQVDENYLYDATMRGKHRHIADKKEAIENNQFMTDVKKAEVIKKVMFWDSLSDQEAVNQQLQNAIKVKQEKNK
jgi:hypothetical protein